MSTSTAPMTLDLTSTTPVPLLRLAKVELRKALDTRAGRWFSVAILALAVLVEVIFSLAADASDKVLDNYFGIVGTVLGYFMPILVVMLVTSEASQRNGLVTFTLEPKRSRVVAAKFLAGLGLAIGLMIAALVLGVLGNLLGAATGGDATWSISRLTIVNGFIVANIIGFLIGFAIGMLVMNTPAGIVAYFAYTFILPGAVGILGALSQGFQDIAPWIEFNTAKTNALFTGTGVPTGEQWAQVLVSGTIWLIIPLVIGIRRLLRIEFK